MKARVTPIGMSPHECNADMPFISMMIHRGWVVEPISAEPEEIDEFAGLIRHEKRAVQMSAGELMRGNG